MTLVIKLTRALDERDIEATNQALNVAAVAAASGTQVSLWLAGGSSMLAVPGVAKSVELPHATPFDELLDTILELGSVTLCSQCAVRRNLTAADIVDGIRIAGAAAFVQEITEGDATAIVY